MKIRALLTTVALTATTAALAQAPQAAPQAQDKSQGGKAESKGQGKPADAAQGQAPAATPAPAKKAPPKGETAKAMVKDAEGKDVGEITFEQTAQGVLVKGTLSNLPPGQHAFHVHETGKCAAPEFKTAGSHFNPHKKAHGIMSPKGKHAGDLPNLYVGQDGRVQFDTFAQTGLTLKSMFDKDGSAVVVHTKEDDYHSDPTGDAGGRIACGVVEKAQQ
ncbi:superoxide dismutase family protein [Pyxidicoccus xibeiensis]|uniref:superoxide dismutase family protein n=1 Tax=Pyxidicoccus xibeiensis TaxID=2906759 RepID=UPI0020A77082|nr:superoxide dismutase family protein [Pyxidicoccus xibeiensis]MCP3142844.1 superoxide dismutase family protein [Pyxidicoccus xibeiensis]